MLETKKMQQNSPLFTDVYFFIVNHLSCVAICSVQYNGIFTNLYGLPFSAQNAIVCCTTIASLLSSCACVIAVLYVNVMVIEKWL